MGGRSGQDQGADHGGGGSRLPRLQRRLPRDPTVRGGRLHGNADPGHRGPRLPGRAWPATLYPDGIPIVPEADLERLIAEERGRRGRVRVQRREPRDRHARGLARARGGRRVPAAGAGAHDADLLEPAGGRRLRACAPAAGKSQTTRAVAALLAASGHSAVVVRHPMPYGDLAAQRVQRFATYEDLDAARDAPSRNARSTSRTSRPGASSSPAWTTRRSCAGGRARGGRHPLGRRQQRPALLSAGPAHRRRRSAAAPATSALSPGRDEPAHGGRGASSTRSTPRTRPRSTQCSAASRQLNPTAEVLTARSDLVLDGPSIEGKRVVVVEDGPTLTHGGMTFGAGVVAARRFGAAELIDPRARRGGLHQGGPAAISGPGAAGAGHGLR